MKPIKQEIIFNEIPEGAETIALPVVMDSYISRARDRYGEP